MQALEAVVEDLLEARLKVLGDKAKTAVTNLPGEPDALAQLEWLTANEELFAAPDSKKKRKPPETNAAKTSGGKGKAGPSSEEALRRRFGIK